MRKSVLGKYRNELGKRFRKLYDNGFRNDWCNRTAMRSFTFRPDTKVGTLTTFTADNLIIEVYEANGILPVS